jgi:hypothetical protein
MAGFVRWFSVSQDENRKMTSQQSEVTAQRTESTSPGMAPFVIK